MGRLLTLAIVAATAAPAAAEQLTVRRYALIAGANDGGTDRVKLRYASTDAEAVAKVLEELGGVGRRDRILLVEPTKAQLEAAFVRMSRILEETKTPQVRQELLVYYSGHSDEQGLLLSGELLGYKPFRQQLDALPADVRIAVLDSCASGALTRGKGGVRRAPFLVDASAKVKGYAFLTSSSADEAAQESDRVGGSFFTHYLVSGLRGAADVTRDGRVTLTEAYQFAFHETLARTENTRAGPQHPNYDIQLAGAGDLVLTDLRGTSASLVVGPKIDGRLFIRDDDGRLVAELHKQAGRPVELGLEPGKYTVTLDKQNEQFRSELRLRRGRETTLEPRDLESIEHRESTVARGGKLKKKKKEIELSDDGHTIKRLHLGIFPGLSNASGEVDSNFSLALMVAHDAKVRGIQASLLASSVTEESRGIQFGGVVNINRGRMRGAQMATISNYAKLANGTQLAGLLNIANDDAHVFQLSALSNFTRGHHSGMQLTAGMNYAGSLGGAQLSLLNISGDVRGTQVGLINIASEVKGTQIGLVNVSRDVDMPIGLFNFVKKGQLHFDIWANDVTLTNASIRFGSEHFYTLVTAGMQPHKRPTRWVAGLGLGAHLPVSESFFFNLDAIGNTLQHGENQNDFGLTVDGDGGDWLVQARVAFGWEIFEHFGIFGGVGMNMFLSDNRDGRAIAFGAQRGFDLDGGGHMRIWPMFFGGFQI